jgi:hypothetical protein
MLYNDVNLINTEIEITAPLHQKILELAKKKYLNPNQRLVLDYVPSSDKAKKIIQNHHENNIYTIKSILTLAMQGQIIPQHLTPPTIKIGKSNILS